MKSILKKSRTIVGLVQDLRFARSAYRHRGRKAAIRSYLDQAEKPCLHIGAGHAALPGWLSTDIASDDPNVVYLDAIKIFPMPDNSFEYIYCEHMIEHVPHDDASRMLQECRRVLKPGGVLRVATPDLAFILSLYNNHCEDAKKYMEWMTAKYLPNQLEARAPFVINNAFRNWGHQFLYDAATLEQSFRDAGFTEFVRERYHESQHAALRGIERHGINVGNEPIAMYETLICEAS